jgi:CHAT domain-containing protein
MHAKWLLAISFLYVFFFVGHSRLWAEDPHYLIKEADRLAWLNNWVKAAPLFTKAEELFAQAGDERNTLYAKLGRIRGEMESKSLTEASEYVATLLQNPIVQNDPILKLRGLVVKGDVDLERDTASCERSWKEVLALTASSGDKAWKARAQEELGRIAFMSGDISTAQRMVGEAAFAAKASGDIGAQIRSLSALGVAMTQFRRYDEALEFCERAMQLSDSNQDTMFPFEACFGKASTLLALNKRAEAKKLIDQALSQAKLYNMQLTETRFLILLGKYSADSDDRGRAIEYLEKAAALGTARGFHRFLAEAMLELARLYERNGQLEEAEKLAMAGLQECQRYGTIYYLPPHLTLMAELKVRRGKLDEAEELFQHAIQVVDEMVVNGAGFRTKSALVSIMSETYLGYFTLAVQYLNDIKKAFRTLEEARGRSTADFLRGRGLETEEERQGRIAVNSEISQVNKRLWETGKTGEREKLRAQVFDAEQKMGIVGPAHSPSKVIREQPVELEKLQQILRPDELVLEYVLNEPASFCLAISSKKANTFSLPGRQRIEELIEQYLSEIKSKKSGREKGKELYSILFGPALAPNQKYRLTIVPDGQLHMLPFDSLRDPQGEYVLKNHHVTLVPSATVLNLLRTLPRRQPAPLPFLGISYVTDAEHTLLAENGNNKTGKRTTLRGLHARYQPLAGTAEEVLSTAKMIGKNSTVLMGDDATEAAFKAKPLDQFKIIHLALHASANTTSPDKSALVFRSDPASREDGVLQGREIIDFRLNADLVILSACDTAVGQIYGGEGTINLVRSWLFAGARSVVATLWSVDDSFAKSLMKEFYRNLVLGRDKGEALRNAKLHLLTKFRDQALPFYWANFVIVGDSVLPVAFSN